VLSTTLGNVDRAQLPTLVCIGSSDESLAAQLKAQGREFLQCRKAGEGMGSTLAEAVGSIAQQWDAVLVALGDMPWIESATYRAVATQVSADTICQPRFEGQRGHPVAFGRGFYPELLALAGDSGARGVVQRYRDSVVPLTVNDAGIIRDIDMPADLHR